QVHTALSLCPVVNFTTIWKTRPGTCGLMKKRAGWEVKFAVEMTVGTAGVVGFKTVWTSGKGYGKETGDGVVRVEWELPEMPEMPELPGNNVFPKHNQVINRPQVVSQLMGRPIVPDKTSPVIAT